MGKTKEVLNIYKPVGISPLDAINSFKKENPGYKDTPMTYAGRLDPLAEGVLIVLAGDAVHEKDKYLKLDKKYEAEILLGFETDTYDILGLAKVKPSEDVGEDLDKELEKFKGDFSFLLPSYSSYKVQGKPLFQWAREGRLSEIEIPKRTTKIYDIKLAKVGPHQLGGQASEEISEEELLRKIIEKVDLVKGDFRQEEIKKRWQSTLSETINVRRRYHVAKVFVHCSSGTYIRSIARELGGVLLSLKRIQVGKFKL